MGLELQRVTLIEQAVIDTTVLYSTIASSHIQPPISSSTMANSVIIVIVSLCLSQALNPAAVPEIQSSSSSGLTASDMAANPPPPNPGESAGQWIDQLFDVSTNTYNGTVGNAFILAESNFTINNAAASKTGSNKRRRYYEENYGLHESVWANETAKTEYNIGVDLSNCSTGLRLWTDVGVYTFANGTTSNNATLGALVIDIGVLRDLGDSINTPNARYANHTAFLAQQALDEANQLLNNGLICQNRTASANSTAIQTAGETTGEIIHAELRRLLANNWSYWTAVILSTAGGAICGGSIAAVTDLAFFHNVVPENVVQTALVIGTIVLITSILTRMHEVGRLDRAERLPAAAQAVAAAGARVIPGGREAVIQNIFIAYFRRTIARMRGRQSNIASEVQAVGQDLHDLAAVEAALSAVGTDSVAGTEMYSCISDLDAAEAVEAIGQMSDPNLQVETAAEVMEQLAGRAEDGGCGV